VQYLRQRFPEAKISVEAENPGRVGLEEVVALADVVFYSKSWAEVSWSTLDCVMACLFDFW
jgi:ketohexokinase